MTDDLGIWDLGWVEGSVFGGLFGRAGINNAAQ